MAETVRMGGYHGGGRVDEVEVIITGGEVSVSNSPGYLNMTEYRKRSPAGRVIHSLGTQTFTGSISLDLRSGAGASLFSASNLFKRAKEHSFSASDGYTEVSMNKCYVTQVSMQASSSSVVSASISFISKDPPSFQNGGNQTFLRDETPIKYWATGRSDLDVCSWSFTMQQSAQPRYANNGDSAPHYIKIGAVTYSLTIESYTEYQRGGSMEKNKDPGTSERINIGTGSLRLEGSFTSGSWRYGGSNGMGTYSYTFESGAKGKSDTLVIS